VGTSKQTIELNGQLYDAATGKQIKEVKPLTTKLPSSGKVVDGFVRRKPTHPAADQPKSQHEHTRQVSKTITPVKKKAQRSATLMRSSVHKPQAARPKVAHGTAPTILAHPVPTIRLKRAHHTDQSKLISKFGNPSAPLKAQIAHLPVQLPPTEAPEIAIASLEHHRPAVTAPADHATSSHQGTKHLEAGLHRAQSHTQPKVKKAKVSHRAAKRLHLSPRILQLSTLLAAFLLIAGFVVYQNVPNLAMRVAATRAGIPANLPGYQPSGFSLSGAIKYSPGQITVSYKSNSDDRSFQLTQRSTQWNNETLLQKFVAVNNRPYQTFQDQAKTIYIYDGSNAAWIQDGIWYQVEGKSSLTSEQLLRLADSI